MRFDKMPFRGWLSMRIFQGDDKDNEDSCGVEKRILLQYLS